MIPFNKPYFNLKSINNITEHIKKAYNLVMVIIPN